MRITLSGLFFMLFIGNTTVAQPQQPATLTQVLDSLQRLMKRSDIPGLMLTIVKDDSVLFKGGLGVSSIEDSTLVNENTLFRLGSVTKSFVALGVLKLVNDGKLTLEDEVKKIAPEIEFENPYEATHPVRVKHLISHTAGFDDMHFRELYNVSEQQEVALEDVIKLSPSTLRVRWEPGSRFAYSNPGWSVAGYLIEKFSGMKYDAYITQAILNPIGMSYSNFRSVPEGSQYASGYKGKGQEVPFYPIYHRPAGAFNSNARDMALWLKFLINNGQADSAQVFRAADIELAELPKYTVTNRAGLPLGYGLGNYTYDSRLPVQFHGHDGGIDGFVSSYGYNREHRVGYALSNNGSKGMAQLVDLVKAFLTKDIQKQKMPPATLDKEAMSDFEGFYMFKASRNQLFAFADRLLSSCRVSVENDTVYLKYFAKERFPVLPVENGDGDGLLFRSVGDYFPSHVFTKTGNARVMATSGVGNYLEQTDSAGVYTRRILFFSSLAFLSTSLLASLVWLIFAIRKNLAWAELAKRVIPAIAALAVFGIVSGMINTLNSLGEAAKVNANNLTIYLGTWVVLFCALLSSRFAIMNFKTGTNTLFSIYYVFLAASTVMMALFLYDAGWMGLKLWEY